MNKYVTFISTLLYHFCLYLCTFKSISLFYSRQARQDKREKSTFWVKQSISPLSPVCRWQVAPDAALCRSRCHRLDGSSDRRSQVLCPHPLQPARPLHFWCACAPLTPRLPVQQRAPGLPPPPPVHEQEDRECTVKVTTPQASCVSFLLSVNAGQHTGLRRFLSLGAPQGYNYCYGGKVIQLLCAYVWVYTCVR